MDWICRKIMDMPCHSLSLMHITNLSSFRLSIHRTNLHPSCSVGCHYNLCHCWDTEAH